MKITVATPRFALAAVPLAQIRFARALANRGHEVTLVVGYVEPGYTFPEISGFRVQILNIPRVRNMFLPLIRYLFKEKPDLVFSAEDHFNIVILLAARLVRSKSKVSCSSRVTPFDTYSNTICSKRWFLKQLARFTMRSADALTCVSVDMVAQYHQIFGQCPHVCAYNIVVDALSRKLMRERLDHPWVTYPGGDQG